MEEELREGNEGGEVGEVVGELVSDSSSWRNPSPYIFSDKDPTPMCTEPILNHVLVSSPVAQAVPSSEASTSTLRPQLQSTSSSPLVFNSFRNSTASESSTYYTSSIYSNSEDNHAYWEGRRPEDDVDQSDEDDARTERGGDDERDDVEDDDGDTTVDDHGGGLSQHHYYESVGLRAEDSTGNSPNFTTSSRISRLLLDSAQDDEDQDPDASFGSQWSASSAYSSASSRQQLLRQELSQSVDSNPSYEYSSSPPPLSPTPSPPSLIRNASIGGVSQRRAEVIRPQIEISSVYGDAGNQWDGGGEAWNRATPPRPSFPSEPSRGGPSPSSPGSGNFSRPMKVSGAGVISPLAGVSSASRQKGVAGGGDYIDPPQRSASLRRKAGGGGDASQLSRSPSPTWTPSTFEHDRKSVDPVPFSQHPNPSPTPSSTVPSPSFSPRLPSNLRQQSSSSTSSRPHSPPPTSPVSPTTPYGPPRPKFAANTFGSSSSVSSISSLPTRRAPPPPVDRPAYNGKLAALDQATTRLVPSSNQPYRQAHPSNGATHWQPTLPSSTPTTSTKFTPQLPSQRKSTYPPNPSLPHQSTYLQQENLSSSSQRIRAYSESEQNYSSPDDPSARPGLSPLTGTSSGRPSFAAVPPKPSFTVTSRDRSGSASSSSATSPLSQQSSSSSDREIVGTPSSLKLSPGTSRAELHPGLFSVCEFEPRNVSCLQFERSWTRATRRFESSTDSSFRTYRRTWPLFSFSLANSRILPASQRILHSRRSHPRGPFFLLFLLPIPLPRQISLSSSTTHGTRAVPKTRHPTPLQRRRSLPRSDVLPRSSHVRRRMSRRDALLRSYAEKWVGSGEGREKGV